MRQVPLQQAHGQCWKVSVHTDSASWRSGPHSKKGSSGVYSWLLDIHVPRLSSPFGGYQAKFCELRFKFHWSQTTHPSPRIHLQYTLWNRGLNPLLGKGSIGSMNIGVWGIFWLRWSMELRRNIVNFALWGAVLLLSWVTTFVIATCQLEMFSQWTVTEKCQARWVSTLGCSWGLSEDTVPDMHLLALQC